MTTEEMTAAARLEVASLSAVNYVRATNPFILKGSDYGGKPLLSVETQESALPTYNICPETKHLDIFFAWVKELRTNDQLASKVFLTMISSPYNCSFESKDGTIVFRYYSIEWIMTTQVFIELIDRDLFLATQTTL
jgi:hypothetical protein